jgi:hypothetical protein
MRRRIRADDTRSDEFLADTGRRAYELGLTDGWTSGLIGEKAKRASDRGTFAWKKARRLPAADFAAGLYVEQCRTRNPVVTASGSGLVLLEVDGEPELLDRFGLVLPETVRVASRRGQHHYFRPPEGRPPLKVQVSGEGVLTASDGYLVGAGALHASGWVYSYVSAPDATIAELSVEMYERILELGGEVRENVRRTVEAGQPLVEGLRRDTIFSLALELAHRGLDEELIAYCMLELNRRCCSPPLRTAEVEAQVRGAIVRAQRRPSLEHELHRRALEALAVIDTPPSGRSPGRPPSKYPEALELVREMLAEGPRLSSEVKDEGRRRGISSATLKRAARELGVRFESVGETGGRGGRITYWHPPEFWSDRSKTVGSKSVGSALPIPLSVGFVPGGFTPLAESSGVLSRPFEPTDSEPTDPASPDERKRSQRRQP